ncbi:unnamed protein product [Oppiella nova]|nr:unnamed protein product [Oppiella nova]CAG2161325.1 unnamed protein product [Oppiella nova]
MATNNILNAILMNNHSINANNSAMNSTDSKTNANTSDKSKAIFRHVVISLENCILPQQQLSQTPSMTDGLDYDHECDLRILGCELIQTSGILLRLPQMAMATGQVLFQRYYYCKSLVRFPMEVTAMACVTLASKVEEAPRRIRDVINVFHHMKQIRSEVDAKPLVLDESYISTKNQVIKAERRLLKELGFCVHVKHPHKFIVTLLQVLDNEKNERLMQTSWNYMNDSLRTNVFVRYSPETIACACIYLSARVLKVPLPKNPNWFEVFNVSEDQLKDICISILKLYVRAKPNQQKLESIVENLRKTYENARLKAKEVNVLDNGTPTSNGMEVSPASRTNSPLTKPKVDNSSPKNKLKSITSVISHMSSPNKKRTNDSPRNEGRSRSKSRSVSPINRDNYDRNRERGRDERNRSPPKSYAYDYSRSRSRSRERNSRHHKHKRITYSRSKSRSPVPHTRHHNHTTKHHSYSHNNRKSRKRSKSPYYRADDRNTYHSRSRRSRSRDLYVHRRS